MGRHNKTVLSGGIDRRARGYYSTPGFVADFITEKMLELNPHGKSVLDPCVGREELLDGFFQAGKQIHSTDLIDFGKHCKATFEQTDFIEFYHKHKTTGLNYDYYIANPPYNCHESNYIKSRKPWLAKLFGKLGVANTYAMFIAALIDLAKPGALIGLITSDSFLTARLYHRLRKKILEECHISHILLCPTDLFIDQRAEVRTCILILRKRSARIPIQNHDVIPSKSLQKVIINTLDRPASTEHFKISLQQKIFISQQLAQSVLLSSHDRLEFVVGCPEEFLELFKLPRLNNLYPCITGISTGKDKYYLSPVRTEYHSIPFYKNPGSRKFYAQPNGFLPSDFKEIAKKTPNFTIRNRDLLFQPGITCSSMGIPFGACYLPVGAAFGVNATIICDNKEIYWLLAYLNSSLVTYIVRKILLRTNMITSGYVSRIPIIPFSKENKVKLEELAREGIRAGTQGESCQSIIKIIDKVIANAAGFSSESVKAINKFCSNLIKLT